MNKGEDRRQSFRITESALVSWQRIDEDVFNAGIARWRLSAGEASHTRSKLVDLDARLDELMFRAASESPAATEVLRLLNDKINIVAHALPEFEQTKRQLAAKIPQEIELGSEGMLLGVDDDLAPDARLVVQFMVLPDNRYFETFARVTRSYAVDDPGSTPHERMIAIEFHGMSPAERENLIQHLFTRQSEALRLRRKEQEDGG